MSVRRRWSSRAGNRHVLAHAEMSTDGPGNFQVAGGRCDCDYATPA
jgi:hypothetical protein